MVNMRMIALWDTGMRLHDVIFKKAVTVEILFRQVHYLF